MSEEEAVEDEAPKKPSQLKTLIASAASILLLGAGVMAVVYYSPYGGSPAGASSAADAAEDVLTKSYENIEFVNLEPLVVTLGPNAKAEFLKIAVSLETPQEHVKTAKRLEPRFRDVLNTYLRSVEERELADPAAMTRLRAQMLRRLQVAASPEVVTNLLITDFVLN